jgi:polyisoprenoid-binding protein YceI
MRVILSISLILYSFLSFSQERNTILTADPARTKIEWTGKKLTGEHYGEIKLSSGELTLINDKLTGGKFDMDMTSITCTDITDAKSNKRLVDHLKSEDFFSTTRFPRSQFVITSVKPKSSNEYDVTGDLTIKGKTNTISFPVKLSKTDSEWRGEGTMTFDRSKYDVKFGSQSFYENLGDKLVYDDVDITINLILKRGEPK